MEITVYRAEPLASEARLLPATTYNLAHLLLKRSNGVQFVPVRAMQFLAIVDAEEIVFVDHLDKREAAIVWHRFRPQARSALDAPVPYEAVYYRADHVELMRRLQTELPRALATQAGKERPGRGAQVLQFARPRG